MIAVKIRQRGRARHRIRQDRRSWAGWVLSIAMILTAGRNTIAGGETTLALDDKSAPIELTTNEKLWHSQFGYLESHPQSDDNLSSESGIQIDVAIPWKRNAFKASVEGVYRGAARDAEDVLLREAYFDLSTSDEVSFRIGQQIFSWGSGVLYNPVDRLTPWDATDPVHARQMGIRAVKLSYASGPQTLEVVYIPDFEPTKLPGIGDRFFIYYPQTIPNPNYPQAGPSAWRVRYAETDTSFEPSAAQSRQYAARYSLSWAGWDLALSYFSGYENTALAEGKITSVDAASGEASMTVNYIYPKERVWGADVSKYFGRLGIHADGAYFDMEKIGHDVGIGDKDYASALGGIDYRFLHVIGSQDVAMSLEYAREFSDGQDGRIYINRIYTDSILLRLAHIVDYKWSGELRYVYNLENESYWGRLSYSYQYSDHTQFTAGLDVFGGPDDTFFGAFDKNDRVFASMTLQY